MMNKKNAKKIILLLIIIFFILPLFCGCWDYVGLNEIGIIIGVAIDKEADNYKLTFEIIDLARSNKQTGAVPAYIECKGKTVFEAIRNSKSRSATKMFFGNIEIIILSEQMAKDEGIYAALDLFIRDAEPRETIKILISQEKTAEEVLMAKGLTTKINSSEIKQIIAKDHKVTSKTSDVELYQAYNVLTTKGRELVMPAFHLVKNKDQTTSESNGVALFKKDKLIGYLSAQDTFFYLYLINEINGGTFVIQYEDEKRGKDIITFELNKSKTNLDFNYDKDKDIFKINIEIKCDVFLAENIILTDESYNDQDIEKIQKVANGYLKSQIESVIKKVQDEYDTDIFGFGNLVYRKDPKLWDKVSKDWDKYFKQLQVEIKPDVKIRNTAVLRS